ncbi:MAG: NUDIX domain-containing protein [Burkholderiales bacterium]
MLANKVCPVIFRRRGSIVEVLAFEHPLAGCQLVKGTIEAGESVEAAALRELAEETGIEAASVVRYLGTWCSGFEGQVWAFVECTPAKLPPESWVHHAPDDGGHSFRFFWHVLGEPPNAEQWHTLYRGALSFVQNAA